MAHLPVTLTIAGIDSGGGAGATADLKVFEASGVWGTLAVTAVTAQNTLGLHAIEEVSAELVRVQIGSVASDLGVDAAKTGMLVSAEMVEAVAEAVGDFGVGPLVIDPIVASSSGTRLLSRDGVAVLRNRLLPLAAVVTPNVAEAAALTGREVASRPQMADAARALVDLGAAVAMVTGGHLPDETSSPDCLVVAGEAPVWLEGSRLATPHTHGTGCALSAAICAELARGMEAADACVAAKHFVEGAITAGIDLGSGPGSVDPGWQHRG
ncbi:MAG: bifunctional hydroxymethylpyrimidine kinase/phosphomethylpyrimidine kinase [Acidimicrobiales bacterium]